MASEGIGPGSFGQRLQRLRIAAGLTQQALAERSGISVDAISGLENGRKRHPRRDTQSMLADGLGLRPAEREALAASARCQGQPRAPRGARRLPEHAAVFLSHTSELREHPDGGSYVVVAESAARRAGHTVTDMANFPVCDSEPGDYCTAMVARADVYVGIIGLRYGAQVRGRPELSYTELEFETATACGLPRLIFLVREDARSLRPARQPLEDRGRQEAFRRRLQEDGVTVAWIATPAELEIGLYQALVELGRAGCSGPRVLRAATRPTPPPSLAGDTADTTPTRHGPARSRFALRRWISTDPSRHRPSGDVRAPVRARAGSRRRRAWLPALAAVVTLVGVSTVMVAPRTQNTGRGPLPSVADPGVVRLLGSQAQPASEYRAMKTNVLSGFPSVDFDSQPTGATVIQTILDGLATGVSATDVTDLTHSEMVALQAHGALEDLTPLLRRLQRDRQFPEALLGYGTFGTDKQYYIPWLQATYMIVVNTKALRYLPASVDVYHLTYDQLIAWGENIWRMTGQKRIGLPAQLGGPRGGLIYRFLQGYAYPSFTGSTLTGFRSPEALRMWETLRRLWDVASPSSTGYVNMQDPLETGEIWIAWDHQARLKGALSDTAGQFFPVPAPSGPRGLGYMTALVGLAIPKGASNRAGAEALIDWLTRPSQQALAGAALNFFPVVKRPDGPGSQSAASRVAGMYQHSAHGVQTMPPAGLGARSDDFTATYQDLFYRIVLRNEDIRTVLNDEADRLQSLVDEARAPCWLPDARSSGPCRIE